MKKINIHSKCITTIWLVFFVFISGLKAQTVFLPSDISGLKLWLTGDSVSMSNPPLVDKCFDLSSAKNNAAPLNTSETPISVNSILNGHKTIRFDGIDDYLVFNPINDIRTVFWVLKEDSTAVPAARAVLGATSDYDFYRGDSKEIWSSTAASPYVLKGTTRLNFTQVNGSTTILPPRYSILSLVTIGVVAGNYLSRDRGNAARVWQGEYAEVVVYNKVLSATEVKQVEDYLHNKYAPAVKLGSDKIVCSLPMTLKPQKYFTSYKWQDNSTADSLVVNTSGTYYVTVTDVFNTTSSDTITIIKDSLPYTVKLGKDTAVCQGASVKLYAGPTHLSYLWSTGSMENSITVNTSGNYSVTVTDCMGNISKDTINVNIHPIPVFNLGKDTLICFNSPYNVDPGFANSLPYTFKWFDGTSDSVHKVTHSDNYYVTIKDNIGCAFSDSVVIKVDSLLSMITLGADTVFCSGNAIGLQKGGNNAVSYLWSTGSTAPTIPVTVTGAYWLKVKSINNCPASDTINVVVSGKAPSSDFSFANICQKNTTAFTDLSTPPTGESIASWNWNFGDSFTSVLQNPTHVYADTGKYTVTLLVTTVAGCSELRTQTVTIYPRPKINFTVSNQCEDVSTSFTGQVTTYGYAVTKWSWNFADPVSGANNVSSLQSPAHFYVNPGTYAVTVRVDNSKGCSDTLTKNVIINPAPVTDFSFSLACKDDSVAFKDLTVLPVGTTNASSYWSFGNGTSTLLNPTHVFPANVKYTVLHVVTASNGCKDTMIKSVDVHASPSARFTNSNSCEKNVTTFTDQSIISIGNITSWQWSFEATGHSNVKNPQYSFVKAGNAIVKQVVTSDFGCKDSISKTIIVNPRPKASFTATPEYGNPGQSVKFNNTTTGATTYSWKFDDGGTSTLTSPTHVYNTIGTYKPMLIAANTIGCLDTTYGSISILKRYMDVSITEAKAQIQNGGGVLLNDYLSVSLTVLNKSTADIFALDFYMEANDGPALKEVWTGKLLKGDAMTYTFKTAPSLKTGDHFVCVYVLNPNGLKDEVPADNKVCQALDETAFKVLSPYPNPTSDLLTIPLIIPNGGDVTITVVDSQGNEVQNATAYMAKGLQQITLDTHTFTSGLYFCRVQLDDQRIVTKFIKE